MAMHSAAVVSSLWVAVRVLELLLDSIRWLILGSDIILAGNNAKFGQPEVKIGTIPGLGGSQRLVRAIGKSRAMEMVLTGVTIPVQELQHSGLIARIVPEDQLVDEALKMAQQIASLSRPVSKWNQQSLTDGRFNVHIVV